MNTNGFLELLSRYEKHEDREYAREYGDTDPLLDLAFHEGVLRAIQDLRLLITVEGTQDDHKAV